MLESQQSYCVRDNAPPLHIGVRLVLSGLMFWNSCSGTCCGTTVSFLLIRLIESDVLSTALLFSVDIFMFVVF